MGESEPKVTVGIPIHNGAASIRATIDSVLHQTYRSLEILVVDNASTDDTEAIVTDMASRDARVRYVRNDENIGQNANFNRVLNSRGVSTSAGSVTMTRSIRGIWSGVSQCSMHARKRPWSPRIRRMSNQTDRPSTRNMMVLVQMHLIRWPRWRRCCT